MTFREILHGKLRGIMGSAWPYLITYLLTSAAVAAWAEHESTPFLDFLRRGDHCVSPIGRLARAEIWSLEQVALVLAWGLMADVVVMLALAVTIVIAWLAMEFFASSGIWCSVRCIELLAKPAADRLCSATSAARSCHVRQHAGRLATTLDPVLGDRYPGIPRHLRERCRDSVRRSGEIPVNHTLSMLYFGVGVALMFWMAARSLIFAAENYLALTERVPIGRARMFDVEQHHRRRAAVARSARRLARARSGAVIGC